MTDTPATVVSREPHTDPAPDAPSDAMKDRVWQATPQPPSTADLREILRDLDRR